MAVNPSAGEKRPRPSPEDQIPEDSGATLGGFQAKRTNITDEPSAAKCRETSSHMTKGLLSLPDEVLLKITRIMGSETTPNQDLRHLALVCRRLRPIAQEVLFNVLRLSDSNLGFVTRTIVENPELFVNTKTLLCTYGDLSWDTTYPLSILSQKTLAAWKQELQQSFGNTQASEMLEHIKYPPMELFTPALVLTLMALLFIKAPRLSKIYMEDLWDDVPLFQLLFAEHTPYESVQKLMHGKLEEARLWHSFAAPSTDKPISFSRYRSLKRLYLDDNFVWELLRTNERLSRCKGRIIQYLPPNLEYLHLAFDRGCRRIEIERYLELTILIEELVKVPSFKKLEVTIEETTSRFLYMILKTRRNQDHIRVHEVKAMLEYWSASSMDLQFHVGLEGFLVPGKTFRVQDLLAELRPILTLPDTQVPLGVVENFIKTQPFFGLENDYIDI